MRRRPRMKRRSLLAAAAALIPAATFGPWWLHRLRTSDTLAAALFTDAATARRIGERYLAAHAEERDPAALAAHLPAGCAAPPRSRRDDAELRAAPGKQRARDFAAGDTVIVDGWILARTEARLCAFAALTA
jgi:hypothetical protein